PVECPGPRPGFQWETSWQRPMQGGNMERRGRFVGRRVPLRFLASILVVAASGCGGNFDFLSGTVNGPGGPEAGVWVIAETRDLPTPFARIVVTDDDGRFVVPDLPSATYDVWVRGYGLLDSEPVQARPGAELALTAVAAPDERAAAQIYPAGYW